MDAELEKQILSLAQKRNVVSERQLKDVERELSEAPSAARGSGSTRIDLLIQKGALNPELVESLIEELQEQKTGGFGAAEPGESSATLAVSESHAERIRKQAAALHQKEITTFGRYTKLEFLGQGGMARVYRAYDPSLDRTIALKFVRAETPELAERLAMEARTQAKVEHEHICKVYEVGQSEGRNYIAMQYIHGRTLKEATGEMTVAEKVRTILLVSEALHAAHRAHLIHRDLKPANIMVEKREDGKWMPFVMDFGLAREVEATGLTQTGMAVGTPSYMSPEQARGDIQHIDHRTDVYSIGATLYELLTGKPPFHGTSSIGILLKVIQEDPPSPRQLDPSIPADLETMVLKCMEKDPNRRYESARALADDLRRYLEGEPVQARPPTWTYRAAKKIRKNAALSVVAAISAIAVLVLAGFASYTWWRAQKQADLANEFEQELQYLQERLRYIYTADLHDVRQEEAGIEKRLKEIEQRMLAEGSIAHGPGHYVLGKGYLTLHQYEAAKTYLEMAWHEHYYRHPQVAYAYGLSLAMLFQRELEKTEQIESTELREERKKELERELRDPALEYIRQGKGTTQAPEYVEALLAYLGKQYGDALQKARVAYERFPWMYEARKLIGDIHSAEARAKHASGNTEEALRLYREGERAYEEVIRKAPGDLQAYIGLATAEDAMMDLLMGQTGESLDEAFAKGKKFCEQGLVVDPEDAELLLRTANLHHAYGENLVRTGGDPTAILDRALEYAKEAERRNPKNPHVYDTLGEIYVAIATDTLDHGKDPNPSIDRAIEVYKKGSQLFPGRASFFSYIGAAYSRKAIYTARRGGDARPVLDQALQNFEESLRLRPDNSSLHSNACQEYGARGNFELIMGGDPRAFYDKAVPHCEKALKLNPRFAHAMNAMGAIFYWKGEYEWLHGADPKPSLDRAVANYQGKSEITPNDPEGYANACEALNLKADQQLRAGEDPQASVAGAVQQCEKAVELDPTMDFAQLNLGAAYRVKAQMEVELNIDPEPSLQNSRKALEEAARINAEYPEVRLALARAEWVAAQWNLRQRKPYAKSVQAARAALEEALRINPRYADAFVLRASLDLMEAEQNLAGKRSPLENITAGVQAGEAALAVNPQFSEAEAVKGALLLLQARWEKDPAASKAAARQSESLLARALQRNANLQRRYGPALEQTRDLLK